MNEIKKEKISRIIYNHLSLSYFFKINFRLGVHFSKTLIKLLFSLFFICLLCMYLISMISFLSSVEKLFSFCYVFRFSMVTSAYSGYCLSFVPKCILLIVLSFMFLRHSYLSKVPFFSFCFLLFSQFS